MNVRFCGLLCLIFGVIGTQAVAQFYPTQYRPGGLDWQQLSTNHFRIIYPQGEDSTAWRTARILETEYPYIQSLTGGALHNFPVILNNYNDRSNGFVTSLHFRSEIDIAPSKGKTLNPQTGGWLANVAPHELVHALQLSNMGGVGVGRVVQYFSPDAARAIHGATPSGVREGLAVYYESASVAPGGGRGNHPYFYNQFNSVFESPQRWSMGQLMHFPDFTRPFNRHYIGGYEFTNWLHQTYGPETSKKAVTYNVQWPFLGYGVALKHVTGYWPGELNEQFTAYKANQLHEAANTNAVEQTAEIQRVPIDQKGAVIRRPRWLSNNELLFHGSFYDRPAGFFKYRLNDGSLHRVATTGSVDDFQYTITADSSSFIYSYYRPDLRYPNAFKNQLNRQPLNGGKASPVAPGQRLHSPDIGPNETLFAIRMYHQYGQLVMLDLQNSTNTTVLFSDSDFQLQSVRVRPKDDHEPHAAENPMLAVVANKNGHQALWLDRRDAIAEHMQSAPEIAFEGGAIYDPQWHPGGHQLLFSSDHTGTMQVYEYELETGTIRRLTDAHYGAFEASYSPDGSNIAFITQQGTQQLPAILPLASAKTRIAKTTTPSPRDEYPPMLKGEHEWTQQPFKTGFHWLKPRTVLPAFEEVSGTDNRYQLGAGLYSSDVLQQQAYGAEVTAFENRLWYDVSYANKQFFPGFRARLFSEPAVRRFRFVTEQQDTLAQSFVRQQRSLALSVPMQFQLQQNIKSSSIFVEPELRQSQFRYFDAGGDAASDFSNATIGSVFGQFNIRLQQAIRDVQPRAGWLLYSELEHYFNSTGVQLQTSTGNTANLSFQRPTALRAGIYTYITPTPQWNQTLRLGVQALTQTAPVFDNQNAVSDGFSNPVLPFSNNLLSLSARYTIPLFYPDSGGFLLPAYLSGLYISAYGNTVTDPAADNLLNASRTVLGGGLRFRFRLSNLSFDIGAGIGVEPSRGKTHFFIGDF